MASDKEQQGEDVRYHARMAQGAKLDGTSLKAKGKNTIRLVVIMARVVFITPRKND